MLVYIVRRILVSIPLLVAASFLSFALTTAMGDPLAEYKLSNPRPSAGQIAAAEQRAGTDKPFLQRYGTWVVDFAKGDWGTLVVPGNGVGDVREKITRASWVTLRLVIGAELLALVIGVAVGVLGAVRQYSAFDYTVTGAAFVMFSMPLFCIAVMVKYAAIDLNNALESLGLGRWLRTAGPPNGGFNGDFVQQVGQYASTYFLPTLCLVVLQFAVYSRFQRASLLEVLESDYVRTARAKGLSATRVLTRHALRTALLPLSTVFALNIGATMGGAFITETVFGWQGLGTLTVDAVNDKEPYMVLGLMMVAGAFTIACNLAADIGYGFLDPRIRFSD